MNSKQLQQVRSKTVDAMELLHQDLAADPELAAGVEIERRKYAIAIAIREAREEAGLTQAQLAEKLGMLQPAIARLESTNYGRVSYTTLAKIADALGLVLEIKLTRPGKRSNIREHQSTSTQFGK
jgi:ribosome-binding protein aMBF1 (putative translation factor)